MRSMIIPSMFHALRIILYLSILCSTCKLDSHRAGQNSVYHASDSSWHNIGSTFTLLRREHKDTGLSFTSIIPLDLTVYACTVVSRQIVYPNAVPPGFEFSVYTIIIIPELMYMPSSPCKGRALLEL